MKKYWESYGWAVALAACVLFVLRMLWGRDAFCGPESEQCLREWLSATGGWIAVASNNAKILLRKVQSIARRAHLDSNLGISTVEICINTLSSAKATGITFHDAHYMMLDLLGTVNDVLTPTIFNKFEEEIEIPWHGIVQTREMVEKFQKKIASGSSPSNEAAIDNEKCFLTACDVARTYCQCCAAIATDLFRDAKSMVDAV